MPAQCPLLGSAGRWRVAAVRCRHVYYWRCAAVLYEPLAMRAQRCAGGGSGDRVALLAHQLG